ncbi:hypothetical protein EV702DRAFT_1202695 [Suillus placidus]|uniref:Amine oxidase domain-containing protein n=1 Tax=Suillus placidus TaxID=48579 RepID=A0A9P6ZM82_9AGAM|nr:hypothetical protein EV702DRAFT_1202695 [Suillus placidus]
MFRAGMIDNMRDGKDGLKVIAGSEGEVRDASLAKVPAREMRVGSRSSLRARWPKSQYRRERGNPRLETRRPLPPNHDAGDESGSEEILGSRPEGLCRPIMTREMRVGSRSSNRARWPKSQYRRERGNPRLETRRPLPPNHDAGDESGSEEILGSRPEGLCRPIMTREMRVGSRRVHVDLKTQLFGYSSSPPLLGYDTYAHHGRNLIQAFDEKLKPKDRDTIWWESQMQTAADISSTNPVGILGAGASGLYAALILQDLGIPYRIIEAKAKSEEDSSRSNFNSMQRVFNLFDYPTLNKDGISLKTKVKPFYFVGGGNNNTLYSYNGVTVRQNAMPKRDPFKAGQMIKDVSNSNPYIAVGVKAIMDDVIGPFATRLLDDLKTGGSEELRPVFDSRSLSTDVINWCGTFDKSTGWYDRALSETVLEPLLLVDIPDPTRLPRNGFASSTGGANEIASCMEQYIRKNNKNAITFNSRVTAIGVNKDNTGMDVVTDNEDHHAFSHVISTVPSPVLRTIDLSKAGLSPVQSNALI